MMVMPSNSNNTWLPCELKSPKEIYDTCRFSYAHLCSYLLQIIYGQCLSYADLFRPDDSLSDISIYLVIPKKVGDINGFSDISSFLHDILSSGWGFYNGLMRIESVKFCVPEFGDAASGEQKYKILTNDIDMLATKITYTIRMNS